MKRILLVLVIGALFVGLNNLYAEDPKLTVKGETHLATESGNVGIGTTEPETHLEVHNGTLKVGGTSSLSQDTARFVVDTGVSTDHAPMELRNDNGVLLRVRGDGMIGIGTDAPRTSHLQIEGSGFYDGVIRLINTGSNGARAFFAATNDDWNTMGANKLGIGFSDDEANVGSGLVKLTIQADGNVGIGTLAPEELLHIKEYEDATGNLRPAIVLEDANGDKGKIAISTASGTEMALRFSFPDDDTRFMVARSNGTVLIVNRLLVGSDETPPADLIVTGDARKPGGGTWDDVSSDIRFKDINGDYEYGLLEIAKLKPVRYNYKIDNKLKLPTDREFIGLVSQDVKDVIPEAVEEDSEGYLTIKSTPIIWAMVNAIRELKIENEKLETRIRNIEASPGLGDGL